ncbi:SRPBCC family protein [Yinghuangia seranimata]|uniref:SRPBCC family protein n=1 Tax=Yinghuangia seranimata TaxID=408067 RepID=UPI00248D1E68|nr:SRPBCC family protein [Yinghuangia seranimata]MDI2124959.1 SRPBCC family protein [Yinghuangia seranimata]
MEWTGQRYADGPTVAVDTYVDAPCDRVWALVADIHLMPELSGELVAVEWLDGATGPALGHRFVGHSRHEAFGEWQTTSYVVEYEPVRRFTWAVMDPENPTATWRFTLRPEGAGTVLEQWMRMGPGRSGLSVAIDRMPEKEQKIVFVRMREFEAAITANLAAIKARAEAARTALDVTDPAGEH